MKEGLKEGGMGGGRERSGREGDGSVREMEIRIKG